MSLPAPCLDNLTVLGELRAVAGRAFDKAKEARDASLMRDCVYLIAEIDRRSLPRRTPAFWNKLEPAEPAQRHRR